MESPVKMVAVGIDTLVLNVYPTDTNFQPTTRRVSAELQEELTSLKEEAQEAEEEIETRFMFHGLPLLMTRKGEHGFQWILRNSKLALAVNRSSRMMLIAQVRCSSEYLWELRDLGSVLSEVRAFLTSIFGEYLLLQPSACDLAVDVVNLDFAQISNVKEQFVKRAQLTGEHPVDEQVMLDGPDSIKQRWGRVTGLPFGARAAALSIMIYDKTHEITYKRPEKKWFFDLWRLVTDEQGEPVWDGSSAVWRIEVRYRRDALNEVKQKGVFHGINDAYELEERLAGLWAYAVGHVGGGEDGLPDGWLRYVVPVADTNRSRWPVHPDWEVVQSAFQPEALPESEWQQEQREREEWLQEVDTELAARPWAVSETKRPARRARKGKAFAPAEIEPPGLDLRPFVRKRKYREHMRRLVGQITGCTVRAEAWRRPADSVTGELLEPDLDSTFRFLRRQVEAYLDETRRDYSKLVYKKRVLYSVETEA